MKRILIIFLTTFLCMQFVSAQTILTGKVIDKKTKTPIEGAVITVKGYKMPSVMTDTKGIYSVNIPEGAKILEISYTGMKTITYKIGKKKTMNFKMTRDLSYDNKNVKGKNKQSKD